MAEPAAERLASTIKASAFAYAMLRLPGYVLELARDDGDPHGTADGPENNAKARPSATSASAASVAEVRAPAPGVLHLDVKATTSVDHGDQVGYVQMHERQIPIVAPAAGVVSDIRGRSGEFLGYGDAVIVLRIAEAAQRPVQAVLQEVPGEDEVE